MKRIVKYLLDTKDKGIIFKLDLSRGLECFVDSDFAGGWKDSDKGSTESVLSRTLCLLDVLLLGSVNFR